MPRPGTGVTDEGSVFPSSSVSDVTKGSKIPIEALEIELTAAGSPRPGSIINIGYRVRSRVDAGQVRVTMVLPEVEAAKLSNWKPAPAPTDRVLPAVIDRTYSLQRNSTTAGNVEVTIPSAGYYRVVLSAHVVDEVHGESRPVQRASTKELWLFVDERDGRVTATFDARMIPDSIRKTPGPRQLLVGSRFSQTAESAAGASMYGTIVAQTVYWHPVDRAYRVVRNVPVIARVFDNYSYAYTSETRGGSDDYGMIHIACSITSDVERMDIEIEFMDGLFNFGPTPGYNTGVVTSFGTYDCMNPEATSTIYAPSDLAHVWNQLHKAAAAGQALFGRSRGSVDVKIDPSVQISRYNKEIFAGYPHSDRITLASPSGVWHTYGAFTQAHEYGHAFHHRALGGYRSGTCGTDGHNWGTIESYECAYAEGVADFFAVATLPAEAPEYVTKVEQRNDADSPFLSGFPARQEIQIAALLYDLIDGANEAHDVVQFPFSYVSDLIRTCEAFVHSTWTESGGDYLLYCLEQQLDFSVQSTYFPGRNASLYREGAAEPSSWCRQALRKLWRWNYAGEADLSPLCN